MSEITDRPRVREVTAGPAGSIPSAAGVLLAALAAAALSEAVRAVVHACGDSLAPNGPISSIGSPGSLRSARPSLLRRSGALISAAGLPPLESAKAAALAVPLAEPLALADAGRVRVAAERLAAAEDLAAVRAAGAELALELDRQHGEVFQQALVEACSEASRVAGFEQVEVRNDGGLARVQALDGAGHALVSEIRLDAAGAASIATEALGWRGHECRQVLDRFDRALEEGGVRSGAPERRRTYGAACLETARETALALERGLSVPTLRRKVAAQVHTARARKEHRS